jgi:hypothetical protein
VLAASRDSEIRMVRDPVMLPFEDAKRIAMAFAAIAFP